MGLGAILFFDTATAFSQVTTFFGNDGVWPGALGTGPLVGLSDAAILNVWACGCVALLAFTFGFLSRVSAALSWLFLVFVHQRNPAIITSGDYLAQVLLFFCIFLPTGGAYSADARFFGAARKFVAAAPWRAMQVDLALLYFGTARLKFRGGWLKGDGIYLSLQHLGYLRPPGAFLLDHPGFCRLSTYVVLACETAYWLLALCPIHGKVTRLGAIVAGVTVQLGILVSMRIGMFTVLMLWTSVLFLPARVRARQTPRDDLKRAGLTALCMSVIVLLAWPLFVAKRWPLPRSVLRVESRLGLVQLYELFGTTYKVSRWQARGTESDGRQVDVFDVAGSGFRSVVGWRFSPFYKLTFVKEADDRAIAWWLCRGYRAETGRSLATIRLEAQERQPVHPGEARPFVDTTLYSGACP